MVPGVEAWSAGCDAPSLPALFEPETRWFVLVTTQVSTTPVVVLRTCDSVADCQARARSLRDRGDDAGIVAGAQAFRAFSACEPQELGQEIVSVDSIAPGLGPACQSELRPSATLTRAGSELYFELSGGAASAGGESNGCGYVVAQSGREPPPCIAFQSHRALFTAPL